MICQEAGQIVCHDGGVGEVAIHLFVLRDGCLVILD